jgi:undecaprenyl-diphosphatase
LLPIFDKNVAIAFGQFLGNWPLFDQFVLFVSSSHLLKGGILSAAIIYAWLSDALVGEGQDGRAVILRRRSMLLGAILSGLVAEIFALMLQKTGSFRLRPFLEPALQLPVPAELKALAPSMMAESSFPSDHAILFFALATAVFLVERRLGRWLYGYVVLFIIFPRLYLGLHYASDVIVGGVIGISFALAFAQLLGRSRLLGWVTEFSITRPGLFYAAMFLCIFQLATMLQDLRNFAGIFRG